MTSKRINLSTLLAWSPTILLSCYVAASFILKEENPSLLCSAINPGGKEFVCGYAYSAPMIQIFAVSVRVLFLVAMVCSLRHLLQRKLTKFGIVGVLLSVVTIICALFLSFYFGSEDAP
ncbi:hypothetical protein [Shewanella sedimentimangrovi]|uniref:Transmembrane protein n=1 Tax=Shewanella sedimentimangrovi TaxID=2814293 RepID=A0ABX7R0T5_9GAMM|nr:hypothetical protein [Shewanella sedimentimangrovi]QSX36471.1 hypothetical protein JYB85_14425 [Shewanella sedimentimangrovi]